MNIFEQLLDLIYKKRCYFCRRTSENTVMCKSCYDQIEILSPSPLVDFDDSVGAPVFSASIYGKNIQKLIRGVKYHNQRELALFQARLMFEFWQNVQEKNSDYAIVPVPLFKSRERKRRYNHMLLVAKEFSKLSGYEVKNDLIKRIKNTKPQYKLSIEERKNNLHGAFEVDKTGYNNENILLIDDIYTTGSTLFEMVKEMRKAGIEKITCLTTSCTASHV